MIVELWSGVKPDPVVDVSARWARPPGWPGRVAPAELEMGIGERPALEAPVRRRVLSMIHNDAGERRSLVPETGIDLGIPGAVGVLDSSFPVTRQATSCSRPGHDGGI